MDSIDDRDVDRLPGAHHVRQLVDRIDHAHSPPRADQIAREHRSPDAIEVNQKDRQLHLGWSGAAGAERDARDRLRHRLLRSRVQGLGARDRRDVCDQIVDERQDGQARRHGLRKGSVGNDHPQGHARQ